MSRSRSPSPFFWIFSDSAAVEIGSIREPQPPFPSMEVEEHVDRRRSGRARELRQPARRTRFAVGFLTRQHAHLLVLKAEYHLGDDSRSPRR